jgi:uncharacterized RDD family membrane protein YckC
MQRASDTATHGVTGANIDASAQITTPSIMRRIACIPYEGLLLLALVLIASFPIAGLKGVTLSGAPHVIFQCYLAVVTILYFSWQWQKNGQTLPMKTWRFRVVDAEGKRLTWARAIVRVFAATIFFGPACVGVLLLFFPDRLSPVITMWFFLPMAATLLFAKFDSDQQFLHDRIAGTQLKDATLDPAKTG